MATDLTIPTNTGRLTIPLRELDFQFARSSGPGGQHVNKVNSKATLRWRPAANESLPPAVRVQIMRQLAGRITRNGELVVTSQRYRDQGRNVADCLEKLRELIAAAARPIKERRPTRPTAAARRRRLADKHARQRLKQDRRPPDPERE